jgi:maleate cis-trans isomerase
MATDVKQYTFGHMSPLMAQDNRHFESSQVFPSNCTMLCYPMNLKGFSGEAVNKSLASFWKALDFLTEKEACRIALGGIPVAAVPGRKRILSLLEEANRKSSVPVTAVFEDVLDAFEELHIKRVVVAAKWDATLMQSVSDYLKDGGITMVGSGTKPHTAAQVLQIGEEEGTTMAIELGRRAFADYPDADALLVAGGAWRSLATVPLLEKEFGRPVINNSGAEFWASMKRFGLRSPQRGWGSLIDSLHGPA